MLYILEIILFATLYYWFCMNKNLKKLNVKETFQPVNLLAIAMIATGMCFFVNFQLHMVFEVLPDYMVHEYENTMNSQGYGIRLIPTINTLILAPIGEEFMFRGVLFYYLLKLLLLKCGKRTSFWMANIVQAVCFGLFHMNLIQGTYAFFIGLVLGYLVYRFESIIPAIISHMIHNFLSLFVWEPVVKSMPNHDGAFAVAACLSICVVVLGMMLCVVNSDKMGKE